MSKTIDMTGQQIGRWTVLARAANNARGQAMWECVCSCDNHTIGIVCGADLRCGKSLSCGCLHDEQLSLIRKKHGGCGQRLYGIWKGIKQRCNNNNNPAYKNYGGRGISICDEWNDYTHFMDWALDNGYADNLTIDRIDVNGNYGPENCRWVTNDAQANNKRTSHLITIGSETKTLKEWCDILQLPYGLVRDRINVLRWPAEEAFGIREHRRGNKEGD